MRLLAILVLGVFGVLRAADAPVPVTPPVLDEALKTEFRVAALRCADWFVANQKADELMSDYGRFMQMFTPAKQDANYRGCASWMAGAASMALLMAHDRSGEARYLEAAKRGGGYIKSLQILDTRAPEHLGSFREYTTQTPWCYPRDAITASWALLWLHSKTGDADCLARARLFNTWFVTQAMSRDWPAWQWFFDGGKHDFLNGSFHGGSAGYFYDYWRVSGDRSGAEAPLRKIADAYMAKFVQVDGSMKVVFDPVSGKHIEDGKLHYGMQKMHRHNDDFGSLALLQSYVLTGERKYLERAEAYAHWLISEQRPDGGFGTPDVPPAAATGPILLVDLYKITGKAEYWNAALKAGRYLLTLQETKSTDKRAFGGVYGYGPKWETGERAWLNIRTSSYAIFAWLKLEGVVQGPYYSAFDKDGKLPRN